MNKCKHMKTSFVCYILGLEMLRVFMYQDISLFWTYSHRPTGWQNCPLYSSPYRIFCIFVV